MDFLPFGSPDEPSLQPSTSANAVQYDAAEPGIAQTGEQISKRTLQNRKAQREFRARRQAYLRDLEDKVRRYESGQADSNTMLQRQIAQLQAENDHLRLQLAEVSRSQQASAGGQAPPPLPPSQHQTYRAPNQPLPPQHQQPGLDQSQLYFPESELRKLPSSPTFEPRQNYSPTSQESLPSLGSSSQSLTHPNAPPSLHRFPSGHSLLDREPPRQGSDPSSNRLPTFDLRTGQTPYTRPSQPPGGGNNGGSSRMSYLSPAESGRSTLPPGQQPMTNMSWQPLPGHWYGGPSGETSQPPSSQPFLAPNYDGRFGRR